MNDSNGQKKDASCVLLLVKVAEQHQHVHHDEHLQCGQETGVRSRVAEEAHVDRVAETETELEHLHLRQYLLPRARDAQCA